MSVTSFPGSGSPATPATPASWLQRTLARFRGDSAEAAEGLFPQSFLDAVPDPFLVVDADDQILAANRAAGAMLGHAPGALVGVGFAETLLPWRLREVHRLRLRTFAESGGGTLGAPDRVTAVRADRSEFAADLALQPAADGSRLLFGVTLREPGAAEAGPSDNRRRTLQTIVDVIPDPIVAVDRAGRVLLRNPASARIRAGSANGDGAPADDALSAEERRDAEAVMKSGVAVLRKEETGPAGRTHLATRVPVCNADGAVVGLVSIAHDVTAQKTAEAQLVADKNTAEAATQANREFLATTSHEVRTLMSGVTGMTMLLLDTNLNEEQREFVDTVRTSSDALLAVINDVLDFSKIEAGMLTVEDEPYAVRTTVAEALAMVSQQATVKGLHLHAEVDAAVPETVSGDAARVRQVLVNLLSNAVKFTTEGDIHVRVQTDEADSTALAFSVADTGDGIAAERLDAVFERFEQADASTARTHGGTGLGLSICLRLVQMMGGEMTADSVPGVGSVFRFTLAGVTEARASAMVFEEFGGDGFSDPAPDGADDEPAADIEALDLVEIAPAAEIEPTPEAVPVAETEPTQKAEPVDEVETPDEIEALDLSEIAPSDETEIPEEAEPVAEIEALDLAEIAPAAEAPSDKPARAVVMSMDAILPSARVLIVEDDAVLQRITSLTLKRLGYRPDIVGNGLEAVEAVRSQSYDVVLMDVMMPVMDGLTATRHIREDAGPGPAPVIVALTANAMQEDQQRCLEAGCDEYLSKPVEPRRLAATIERAIREKGDRQPTEARTAAVDFG